MCIESFSHPSLPHIQPVNLLKFHCSDTTRSPVEHRELFKAGMSTSRKQNRLSICSIDFTRSVASSPAIKLSVFMKHRKNLARVLSFLKIQKKLGKTQYITKWKLGASVMLCRMQEQTDHSCQDASVS